MKLREYPNAAERRQALEKHLAISLPHIGTFTLDEKQASSRNCENMIGTVQVPVGVAGPLEIRRIRNQESGIRNCYFPLATTEGALVASVNRGCRAISESGGVTVISKKIGITRAPVFAVNSLAEGKDLITWVEENFAKLKTATESTSNHLILLGVKPWLVGRSVYLRFAFDTQEAMGMNMVTIAVSNAASLIEKETGSRCVALSGNLCVDKKPNYLNFIEGRGYTIWAESILPEIVIGSVLKTTGAKIAEVAKRKLNTAGMLSGTIGANAQFANVLAAIFLATGQDLGHISECSMGVTSVEETEKGLSVSIYLPDLVVGTVGGGTQLATAKEALSIMNIRSEKGSALKLAEIIGGAVLAGEISLLSSLAENTLAKAHMKFGRGLK